MTTLIDRIASLTNLVAAVGCGLVAGVMLAFSISVLPGLASLPVTDAVAAMQRFNAAILNPLFLTLFLGTAVSCALATILTFSTGHDSPVLVLAGAVLYVVGCFAVTMALNVPLNDALAGVDPGSPAGAQMWHNFTDRWTVWNNVRTVAATAACAVLILGQGRSVLG
ncbi:anthrone oxygenase family protein [Rhodococcoides yunnanense]|uniref:Anthrone oxygenase family protein n=1 Tax=Rhodococcoides yunnanense TaxID=278209 RepID=A0ABU4BDY5_9NOCA|nr:anthrone oxygenase family protein [Rhodococcus yunnanensis]MDV6262395.1 anthrone oxygenase family protein [Rhodococcus yunnanensis]